MKPRPIADLPSYRVCSGHPFNTTGIDYAGPLLVKDVYTEDPRMNKSYILLFICATTRCVQLELTPDMSTPTPILALRLFLARKRFPETFISDNFKSFKSVMLKKFLRNKFDWKFILGRSPWWGAFYERLVKVVKDSLHKVVKNARLSYDELITVLIEIEAVINSRPLTYLSEESNTEAITPFHLLHGRNIAAAREMNLIQRDVNTGDLTNRMKYIRLLLSHFWKRFYNEYTVALLERMMYDKTKRIK